MVALTPVARADAAVTTLRGMSLEQKVGQLFVTYVNGQAADVPHPKNQTDFGVTTAAEMVRKYQPGGVIYFNNSSRDNIDTPKQIAQLSNGLQKASRVPLLISIDQEMGVVTRIGPPATQLPGNMALGAGRSTRDAEEAARITGSELRAMGINQNFAPDADVNSNPVNPIIGVRSFSSDPKLAAEMTAAQVRGYEGRRLLDPASVTSTAKHFPGHGDTSEDSHTALPVSNRSLEQWRQIDSPPFKAAIDAKIDSIMTAHIQVPQIDPSGNPATLSPKIITGLLRDELGYDGVVVTDSLEMAGVRKLHSDAEIPVLAIKAGVDQLLMPPNLGLAIDSVLKAVRSGEISEKRIDESVLRILKMKLLRGVMVTARVDENRAEQVVGSHTQQAQAIADRTVTAVRNDGQAIPLNATAPLVVGTSDATVSALATRLKGAKVVTAASPTAAQVQQALAAAAGADKIVVLTNNLSTRPAQLDLLNQLVATGKPVIAAATANPYDVAHGNAKTWLATYSTTTVSMEALAKVLLGETTPRGKLPVDVPGPTPYPFGHGVTW
ncbi:glycoside hydrolase family 3 N-terminal domain-containing protein [Lentzea sp. DG1S-22]|uniref:glycoside hydrolase family 3 protein n=1 Tax=Lentzea sp. DG1S-22 TaxID=3108822 RepID=UPI002E76CE94|nr:glycoside hydrolase family 3 N-terminal domain-containing protein [Lentzea sp. DG1S-22]WVH84983.1 glycoside hydrolase family 3 N-terminal domain-containing protein [Lentzea sp. DG1S-22]